MAGNPITNPNWAPELADTVERVVGTVRDTATTKAVMVVRGLVFGIVCGLAGLAAFVLAIVVGTRFLQTLVNIGGWIDRDSSVWVSYMLMGALLALAGAICMHKRKSPLPES